MTIRNSGILGLFVASMLLLPVHGQASHEGFGTYEDWSSSPTIPGKRWRGSESFGAQEVKRGVRWGKLVMRFRREGETSSDSGTNISSNFLNLTNPTAVDQMKVDFRVNSLTLTGCTANPSPSLARPARLQLARFNDGTSPAAGDKTGDHVAWIEASRDSNTADPPGVLRVSGHLIRCTNPTCSTSSNVSSASLPSVQVRKKSTLRLIWDSPNNRFLVGVGTSPDVPLTYAVSDSAEAVSSFADIDTSHITARCTAGPTEVDTLTQVGVVQTNVSAIIP